MVGAVDLRDSRFIKLRSFGINVLWFEIRNHEISFSAGDSETCDEEFVKTPPHQKKKDG